MKLTNLFWVLGLASATAACNSGPPVEGCPVGQRVDINSGLCTRITGTGGTGGGGTGGTGGITEGECTNDADDAVYAALEYTDKIGIESSGAAAASAIASDCVFGSTVSVPPLVPGCNKQALAVLACAGNAAGCPQATIAALTVCVQECQADAINTITGSNLTAGCEACYSESVACSASLCADSNCANPNSPMCIECRCIEDCTPGFDRCSGLPASGACDPYL
ncbi:MAG: hypothetical protein WCE62_08240 [Polyangiales bacterium]